MSQFKQVFDKIFNTFIQYGYDAKRKKHYNNAYDFKKNGVKCFGMIENKTKGILFYFCSKTLKERGYLKGSVQREKFIERIKICFNDESAKDFEYDKNNEVRVRIYTFEKANELINDFIVNIKEIAYEI